MIQRVSILDLGLGNLRSVARAFERAGGEASIVSGGVAVRAADALVVPGQGAFRDAARALEGDLGEAVRAHIDAGRPYLGLCLGMQVLFDSSDESPGDPGLGLWRGRVVRFGGDLCGPDGERLKVPHMGWNVVEGRHALLPPEGWFYFVDRMGDTLRRRGENISTYEVEQPLLDHPAVMEVAVVAGRAADVDDAAVAPDRDVADRAAT